MTKPTFEAIEIPAQSNRGAVSLMLFICQTCGTAGTGSFTSWHVCPPDPRSPSPDIAGLAGDVVRRWELLSDQEGSQLRRDYRALDVALARLAQVVPGKS